MDDLTLQLYDNLRNSYFGKYRAIVVDNIDPQKRGRVKLTIPSILGTEETDWALPCFPFGGAKQYGFYMVPEIGSRVWVEFEEGNLSYPIWIGSFWHLEEEVPSELTEDKPTTRLLKTPSEHSLLFEDAEDKERICLKHKSGAHLDMDSEGSLELTDSGGSIIRLDAENSELHIEDKNGNKIAMTSQGTTIEDSNGNKVEMGASGINVKGNQIVIEGQQVSLAGAGGEPLIKGQSFLQLYMAHTHPSAAGPTGPPIPTGAEMTSLSSKVKSA